MALTGSPQFMTRRGNDLWGLEPAATEDVGYDAALLDGDHTYAGVSKDWQLYRNIAPIIAFHDIVGTGQAEKVHGNPVEVPRLWAEVKDSGVETVEFVSEGSKMGIGVVLTGEV